MASTPASPTGDTSRPTSPQLTPRSRVKAMLAAVDSSDDENKGPIDTKSLLAAVDKNKQKPSPSRVSPVESADESDDEDTEVIRPRGRIAARMHANFATAGKAPNSQLGTPQPSRQDRTSPSTSEHSSTAEESSHGREDDDEGEDEVVAPSRRKLARLNRELTPETAIQAEQHSSPQLPEPPSLSEKKMLSNNSIQSDSDKDDMPIDLSKSARFKALVEKKRKERLDKEADEERKRIERTERMREQALEKSDADEDDVSDISDDDGGHRLTQGSSRPARKASKKALEEMNRETQRLSRSLQLSHEVKTKKKISKASLFQRFNFQARGSPAESGNRQTGSSRPTTPGSTPQTDAEPENNGTPPSSLPTSPKPVITRPTTAIFSLNHSTPAFENEPEDPLGLKSTLPRSSHNNKVALQADEPGPPLPKDEQLPTKALSRRFRVKLPPMHADTVMVDFDEELDIAGSKKKDKLDAVFARIPESKAQEPSEMKILRNLAHLSSPPREQARGRNTKLPMTMGELHLSLQQRAKAQAKLERQRRVESLRSKGIVVQSAEERQRAQEEVEDMLARAQQEAEAIMQRERAEAKANRKKGEGHEEDPLAWDDSDDDSYDANRGELPELELSGSEDEQEEANEEDNVSGDQKVEEDQVEGNPVFMDEAEEAQHEDEETSKSSSDFSDDDIEEVKGSTARQSRRSKKHVQIISDDEDEDGVEGTPRPKYIVPKSPSMPGSGSPKPPTSVLRSATKTFIPGLPVAPAAPAGLGLTQIFAGTMDDSQAGSLSGSPQEFMPSIDQFPGSQFSATAGQSQHNDRVPDSQSMQSADSQACDSQTEGLQLHYSQSQAHGFDSLIPENATQMSYFLDPTQDSGFQDFTPLKQRFIDPPQSTTSTVLLTSTEDEAIIQESPLVRKRGKLLRRNDVTDASSSLPSLSGKVTQGSNRMSVVETDGLSEKKFGSYNAFGLMAKAARQEKRLKKFDKKKSKANEMVEEQAEESEDEYAGLGGADGENSSEEDEELIKEMIDDSRENEWDAAQLAGIHADQDRARDAAQIDKLFRDITTGALRKRRRGGDGQDFDLSDSDDGGEARRRMKRRQFTKMQKALFADERIGKIAENPRTAAFLKTIEDMKDDDELDFGNNFVDTTSTSDDSQSQNVSQASQAIPDSQPPSSHRKRSHTDDHGPRPRPDERRTKNSVHPSPTAEVRRSLLTLLDAPNTSTESVILATDVSSDSDGEDGRQIASLPSEENRRSRRHVSDAVIDRIKLKRNSSSSLSTGNASANARLAFSASSTAGSGFKVPDLLRRATTNSTKLSSSSNQTASTTTSNTGQASTGSKSSSLNKAADFDDDGKLRKTAGKRSGINYFAHENERRAKVAEAEKRREAKKWKGAEGRSKVVGSLFGSGSFE